MDFHFGMRDMPDGDSAVYLVFSWLELESVHLWHRASVIEEMERYDRQYGREALLKERDRLRYEVEFMAGFKRDERTDLL